VTDGLRERLRALPGMDRVLPALEGLPPAFLVGGAVRDLLRGARQVDLDVAMEGNTRDAAYELAERLGGHAVEHERFGTATVRADGLALDLARTRRERYLQPGALPVVEPAPLVDDLRRRDFTVNAMAVGLTGEDLGHLHDPLGGRRDLEARLLRVLHEVSFLDDPTRLLRGVRYEARLGFAFDPDTEKLAREAASNGALATVSGHRVGEELLALLGDQSAPAAVRRLVELGLAEALHPALDPDPELVASAQLGRSETGADPALAALAAFVARDPDELADWVESLDLPREARQAVLDAAREAPMLAPAIKGEIADSELWFLLSGRHRETLALTLALGAPGGPVLRFLSELRDVRLEITGDDLVAAGVDPSPAVGLALKETLRRKLDGEVAGRDEELRFALDVARGAEE
jgi:tRNA nucleotidyltransferase (CCA-adding enzyme)